MAGGHDYPDDGAYPVTVCVTDDDGDTGCDTLDHPPSPTRIRSWSRRSWTIDPQRPGPPKNLSGGCRATGRCAADGTSRSTRPATPIRRCSTAPSPPSVWRSSRQIRVNTRWSTTTTSALSSASSPATSRTPTPTSCSSIGSRTTRTRMASPDGAGWRSRGSLVAPTRPSCGATSTSTSTVVTTGSKSSSGASPAATRRGASSPTTSSLSRPAPAGSGCGSTAPSN